MWLKPLVLNLFLWTFPKRTRAIIPVHEFGQAAAMDKILKIANKYNLDIIEDAACALGTVYKGQKVGKSGSIGCYSFHPRKIITTGEGGLVITNNDDLANKISAYRNHGFYQTETGKEMLSWGLNLRMTDIQAAVGIPQITILDDYLKNRTRLAGIYSEKLKNIKNITLPGMIRDGSHTYQTYHILLANHLDQKTIITQLHEQGIETNLGAQAIHLQPYYVKKYRFKEGDFPNAERAFKFGLALPIGHHINEQKISFIAKKIKNIVD